MLNSVQREPHLAGNDLSDLEVQVLTEIARGITSTEVALKLFIYEDAVKRHFRSAMKKLGARDHAEAMAWVKRHLPHKPDAPVQPRG